MNVEFWTITKTNGEFIVKPKSVPTTKEEALLSVEALQMYYENHPMLYLDLQNSKEYFETLENLLRN